MTPKASTLLQGNLELIILSLLRAEPTNGYDLAQRIEALSKDVLTVNAGSLYPALYRLEERGFVRSKWSEGRTGRRAKVYTVTADGVRQLDDQKHKWARFVGALSAILKVT